MTCVAAAAAPATTVVLTHIAANLRGRRVDAAVDSLSNLAAAQRERIVAQVRVAIELSAEQRDRYKRHLLLPEVGEAGQQKLLESKVLLLGAGGLGFLIGELLDAEGARAYVVVVGGAALNLLGVVERPTRDVDVIALGVPETGAMRLTKPEAWSMRPISIDANPMKLTIWPTVASPRV